MNYLIQVFGGITVGQVAALVAAICFLLACYRKFAGYITEKAIREREKDQKIQQVIEQSKQYPQWHQQSIDIRDRFNESIEVLNKSIDILNEKIDTVNWTLNNMEEKGKEDRTTDNRYRIIRFDDEIRHGMLHSKEHFDQILEDINEYELYCAAHKDYRNNKAVMAIENIKRVYKECTNEGTFL